MLWRLYAATSNYFSRSLDQERVHGAGEAAAGAASYPSSERASYLAKASRARALLARSGFGGAGEDFTAFLEGFPKRYLESRAPEEIAAHYRMARQLGDGPVQLTVQHLKHFYELTVLSADRPFLFASLTGTLAAWGMNILKADAFSNSAGIVLDTFRFVDLYQTLEMNPSEIGRFEQTAVDVVRGKVSVAALLSGRASPQKLPRAKVAVPTQIRFDDASSSTSTLLELITQDRPGLLYRVSSTLAELGCNIEVALIDTEGQKVIDVFYLTSAGAQLDSRKQEAIRQALLRKP
jgi:[protein-PII] uridylyltransferase